MGYVGFVCIKVSSIGPGNQKVVSQHRGDNSPIFLSSRLFPFLSVCIFNGIDFFSNAAVFIDVEILMPMFKYFLSTLLICMFLELTAQEPEFSYIPAGVNFDEPLLEWDGFGFNYVETAQTRDYDEYPQDYGGFSLLDEKQRHEILELVFGNEGLQVQIVKMFLDPFHQQNSGSAFDHEKTTANMRYFVGNGNKLTQERGDELEILTTLYGPPDWATQQDSIGGRDLDTTQINALCNYMIDWIKYLRSNDYPVRYLSLHNEGEDFYRWDFTEGFQRLKKFDYNMYWPPAQVNHFLRILPGKLNEKGLKGVALTNGEPSNWTRFYHWGYSEALINDQVAFSNLDLLTTHGFIEGDFTKLSYGLADGNTTEMYRMHKPNLHSWITSYSWGKMGTDFIKTAHEHIYTAKVNALIPWAGIQDPSAWLDGDPNPGSAIRVTSGTYEILPGYYFYKQLTTAGHRGMAVAKTHLANPVAFIIAFSKNGTVYPDAFVVTSNISIWSLPIDISIRGTESTRFRAFRSSEDGNEKYKDIGVYEVTDGSIIYDPPAGTTTTFIAMD